MLVTKTVIGPLVSIWILKCRCLAKRGRLVSHYYTSDNSACVSRKLQRQETTTFACPQVSKREAFSWYPPSSLPSPCNWIDTILLFSCFTGQWFVILSCQEITSQPSQLSTMLDITWDVLGQTVTVCQVQKYMKSMTQTGDKRIGKKKKHSKRTAKPRCKTQRLAHRTFESNPWISAEIKEDI